MLLNAVDNGKRAQSCSYSYFALRVRRLPSCSVPLSFICSLSNALDSLSRAEGKRKVFLLEVLAKGSDLALAIWCGSHGIKSFVLPQLTDKSLWNYGVLHALENLIEPEPT